jgi:hypothetical protein
VTAASILLALPWALALGLVLGVFFLVVSAWGGR